MGGLGSGRLFSTNRRTTVEQCLSISASTFTDLRHDFHSGRLTWNDGITGDVLNTLKYSYYPEETTEPLLVLSYILRGDKVTEPISFQKTTPHFGGSRWWFICPLCSRRVGKLYLARARYYFACRHCYQLSYKSSQKSRILRLLRTII